MTRKKKAAPNRTKEGHAQKVAQHERELTAAARFIGAAFPSPEPPPRPPGGPTKLPPFSFSKASVPPHIPFHPSLQQLAWLLHPISLRLFFADYWERQPLHISRGDAAYYGQLLGKADIDRFVEQHGEQLQYGTDLNVCRCVDGRKVDENPRQEEASTEDGAGQEKATDGAQKAAEEEEASDSMGSEEDDDSESESPPYLPVSAEYVSTRFKSGSTLQVLQPQRFSSRLLTLLSHLEGAFSSLCNANAYLTPPSSQGLALHNDDVEVFACQTEGQKEWRLYRPLDPLAREHSRDYAEDEVGPETHRIVLQPGDLLYLPRGTIHQANTHSSPSSPPSTQHSLHLTISCYQRTSWFDYLRVCMNQALERLWHTNLAVREGLPVGWPRFVSEGQQLATAASRGAIGTTAGTFRRFDQKREAMTGLLLRCVNSAAAGDELAMDFYRHRLPPLPKTTDVAVGGGKKGQVSEEEWREWLEAEPEEKYDVGPMPADPTFLVRLHQPEYLHVSFTHGPPPHFQPTDAGGLKDEKTRSRGENAEDGGMDEVEEEKGEKMADAVLDTAPSVEAATVSDGGQAVAEPLPTSTHPASDALCSPGQPRTPTLEEWIAAEAKAGSLLRVTHALHNDPLTHMDSRHPPPATGVIEFPLSFTRPMFLLLEEPQRWRPLASLGAEGGELCLALWRLQLLQCRAPNGDGATGNNKGQALSGQKRKER